LEIFCYIFLVVIHSLSRQYEWMVSGSDRKSVSSIIGENGTALRELPEQVGRQSSWVLERRGNPEPEQQSWYSKLASGVGVLFCLLNNQSDADAR
jgi:hypothetical protein